MSAALGAAIAVGLPAFFLGLGSGPAPAQDPAGANEVHYRIQARLDLLEADAPEDPQAVPPAAERRLTGSIALSWTNQSGEPVSDLWFHLYWNAYSTDASTHLTESGGLLRGVTMGDDEWGWQRMTAARLAGGGADLLPSLRWQQPDDANEDDLTVFSLDLPQPVTSGETVELELEWEARVPRVRRRTGYKDEFLLMAHWFPKLGVYEAGRGWNCHQFHMNTEFYSDYGTYEVSLDLPREYSGKVFGSGGEPIESANGEDRVLVRFLAPSREDRARMDATGELPRMHAFSWTADPDFVVWQREFEWNDWAREYATEVEEVEAALGREVTGRDVKVTVLIQKERAEQAERHYDATCAALFFYGLWWGEYPYEHITVIDPPWGGRAAGGMEYPTLFTCGTRKYTFPEMYVPESVTVHEAGHQFWYGLVGNNEFEAAWLDEGFNSYTDSEVLFRRYGPSHGTTDYASLPMEGVHIAGKPATSGLQGMLSLARLPLPYLDFEAHPVRRGGGSLFDWWVDQPLSTLAPRYSDPRWDDRGGYLRDPNTDPIETWAFHYADRNSYRTNSYPRPAVALRTLEGVTGRAPFLRGMRAYSEDWRYRHPYGADFYAAFEEGSGLGEDIAWYWDEVFQSTATGDWSVQVSQSKVKDARGFGLGADGQFALRESEEEPQPEDPAGTTAEPDVQDGPWRVEVLVRRDGTLSLPLPIRMRFANETERSEVWSREQQLEKDWLRFQFVSDSKLSSVELDPEGKIYMDADMSNNQWFDEADSVTGLRWGERVFSQYAHFLHRLGGIGG